MLPNLSSFCISFLFVMDKEQVTYDCLIQAPSLSLGDGWRLAGVSLHKNPSGAGIVLNDKVAVSHIQ